MCGQTHQNILFFRSGFVSEHIHVESRGGPQRPGTTTVQNKGNRGGVSRSQSSAGAIFFSSEWIPPQLVVSLETAAVSRTVARDPMSCLLHGNIFSPREKCCGEFYGIPKKKCFQRFMCLCFKDTRSNKQWENKTVFDQDFPDLGTYKGCTNSTKYCFSMRKYS